MKIPRHVGCNGVESARFEFEQTVPSVLARDTEIVHFTRKNAERFAVEKELSVFDLRPHFATPKTFLTAWRKP